MRRKSNLSSTEYFVVTPSDTTVFQNDTRAIVAGSFSGVSGTICVVRPDGVQVDIPVFYAGQSFSVVAKKILATGTNVSNILALF